MGQLTPGATYIYERVDNKVYARESGKTDRALVGYDYREVSNLNDNEFWRDLLIEARTNEALKKAVDHVIMLYLLVKKDPVPPPVMHHPV